MPLKYRCFLLEIEHAPQLIHMFYMFSVLFKVHVPVGAHHCSRYRSSVRQPRTGLNRLRLWHSEQLAARLSNLVKGWVFIAYCWVGLLLADFLALKPLRTDFLLMFSESFESVFSQEMFLFQTFPGRKNGGFCLRNCRKLGRKLPLPNWILDLDP